MQCLLSSQSHFSMNLLTTLSNAGCPLSRLLGHCHIEIGFHKVFGFLLNLLYTRLIILLDSCRFVPYHICWRTSLTHYFLNREDCVASPCVNSIFPCLYISSVSPNLASLAITNISSFPDCNLADEKSDVSLKALFFELEEPSGLIIEIPKVHQYMPVCVLLHPVGHFNLHT